VNSRFVPVPAGNICRNGPLSPAVERQERHLAEPRHPAWRLNSFSVIVVKFSTPRVPRCAISIIFSATSRVAGSSPTFKPRELHAAAKAVDMSRMSSGSKAALAKRGVTDTAVASLGPSAISAAARRKDGLEAKRVNFPPAAMPLAPRHSPFRGIVGAAPGLWLRAPSAGTRRRTGGILLTWSWPIS
jgi:hypothetical protein